MIHSALGQRGKDQLKAPLGYYDPEPLSFKGKSAFPSPLTPEIAEISEIWEMALIYLQRPSGILV